MRPGQWLTCPAGLTLGRVGRGASHALYSLWQRFQPQGLCESRKNAKLFTNALKNASLPSSAEGHES